MAASLAVPLAVPRSGSRSGSLASAISGAAPIEQPSSRSSYRSTAQASSSTLRPARSERPARPPRERSAASTNPPSSVDPQPLSPRRREAVGIVLLGLSLFVALSVVSFVLSIGNGELMGPVGRFLASGLYQAIGASVVLLSAGLIYGAVRFLRAQPLKPRPLSALGSAGLFASTVVLLHVVGVLTRSLRLYGLPPGGALGEYLAELLIALLGTVGTLLVTGCVLLLSLLATTAFAPSQIVRFVGIRLERLLQIGRELLITAKQRLAMRKAASTATAATDEKTATPLFSEPAEKTAKPSKSAPLRRDPVPAPIKDYGDDRDQRHSGRPPIAGPIIVERKAEKAPAMPRSPFGPPSDAIDEIDAPAEAIHDAPTEVKVEPATEKTAEKAAEKSAEKATAKIALDSSAAAIAETPGLETLSPIDNADTLEMPVVVVPQHDGLSSDELSEREAAPATPSSGRPAKKPHQNYLAKHVGPYSPPPLTAFDYEEPAQRDLDRRAMLDLAQRLEGTLADYQVKGRVTAIHPGPVVTMYEFVPAPGTKLSKITALSSDLAMALEALRVRIVAPIPGKAAVGIEVPNRGRETVYLKEILADSGFIQARSKLTMALGKDISGAPVCVDLAKMPHLLVAGTTGSGKSVSVNGMITSILCNASPDEVKMIMIDPKMLELSIYEGIPHLLLPVVTDPKKANLALKWAVDEMERRYELISKAGLRDIGGYNKKIEKQLESIASEQRELFGDDDYDVAEKPVKLPYIVVLIDEFADLMMVASKEVEISVARIAQKARAAGIHLILATQRPSVDVITGLIKANFPSRIAFQVASRIDSRTILDQQGAENLLGMGDMLFTDRGQALRRVHGALITDAEVHRVVEHLKLQGQPIYDMDILKPRLEEEAEEFEEDMSDELYDQAVRLVCETRQASISMVQRRLRIGYNRSARMIERMEREGIVSAADGPKGREVLGSSL